MHWSSRSASDDRSNIDDVMLFVRRLLHVARNTRRHTSRQVLNVDRETGFYEFQEKN